MTYNTLRTSGESDDFFIKNMTTPEPTDPNITYKVLRLTTEGYTEVDTINAVKLTKTQCDQVIQNLIAEGVNPREIKAVKDN